MPVFYFCRDVDAVAWFQFDGFFSLFLIVSTSCNTYEDLSSAVLCMVNMPVYGIQAQMLH